jgi:expansin (peptidoglycan-binding protein)
LALGTIIIGAGACGDSGSGGHLFESSSRKSGSQPGVGGGQELGDSGGTDSLGDGGTAATDEGGSGADTLLGGYPPGQGGSPVTGGSSTGTGGAPPGSTGGRSTGGSPAANTGGSNTGTCTFTGGPSSSSGELTCYWFSQGTATGQGCSSYKTYCGYCGTESGSGSGTCPSGISNTVTNIANPQYFVALTGPGGNFANGRYCGMCVEVTYGGRTIIATVVDACATCTSNAHVDLSLSASVALGLGQGSATGHATSGVTWRTVNCPVTGNIVAVANNGYTGQFYFQNVAFPVASATAGGRTASQQYGYWDFGAAVGGQSVTLRDTVGHTVTGTLPSSSGSIGTQFPLTCQ